MLVWLVMANALQGVLGLDECDRRNCAYNRTDGAASSGITLTRLYKQQV